jgi:hypothetical protein
VSLRRALSQALLQGQGHWLDEAGIVRQFSTVCHMAKARLGSGTIDGYTRDDDSEPGSRCKSDTVLATVTRELEPHVATGPTGLGRRGESAGPGSQEIACIVV